MKEKLTLTLTRDALDRLIGGNTEVEYEIRQQVLVSCLGRHIKQMLKPENIKDRLDAMCKEAEQQYRQAVERAIGSWNAPVGWNKPSFKFNTDIHDLIQRAARDAWDKHVYAESVKVLDKIIAEITREGVVERLIESRLTRTLDQMVTDGVKKRLEQLQAAVQS